MEPKKHRRKINYSLLVVSDSAEGRTKKYRIRPGLLHFLSAFLFVLAVVVVCFCVYSFITMTDARDRSLKQADEIARLTKENGELTAANEELGGKVAVLSETVNQKVEAEAAMEAEAAERHLPKAFPLTGSAVIQGEDEADNTDEGEGGEDGDAAEEQQTLESEDPIVIFNAASGANVVAAGDGTVLSVDSDAVYGHSVSIDHGNGYVSIYRNEGDAVVKTGDAVTRGSALYVIGEENGKLGYQIKNQDAFIDPMEMLEING